MNNVNVSTLEVNEFARRNRHLRIFSKATLLKLYMHDLAGWAVSPLGVLKDNFVVKKLSDTYTGMASSAKDILPVAPQKRFLLQGSLLALSVLIVSSFTPGASSMSTEVGYVDEYVNAYAIPGDILISDENGFIVKTNPQTNQASRIGMTDHASHTVESGESLSLIAQRYGVKVETIMWANDIVNVNSLRIGQKLLVPPVDGIGYNVEKGDTIDKIAKKYKISAESIIAQNSLESQVITKGQSLFLPAAKPIQSMIASNVRADSPIRATRTYINAESSSAKPVGAQPFIFPTIGRLTQGFHKGHYAYDIADSDRPPVWAAGGGTVVKASSGTWGGGYGNHVIIDHGNGLKTLYAHLQAVNVVEGQSVSQGDVVGIMGNTGRVYGRTGIHLHFEVIDNGVKKVPSDYY